MTLRELWMLAARYWVMVLATVVVCTALGFAYDAVRSPGELYKATSRIVAGSNLNSVAGFAESAKHTAQDEFAGEGISVSIDSDTSLMTVTITVESSSPQACVQIANSLADATNRTAIEICGSNENPYLGEVSLAAEATEVASRVDFKYIACGFVGGVFISAIILVLIDRKKGSIKTPEAVQQVIDLPVLDVLPTKNGEKLSANIRFAADRLHRGTGCMSVLVVPVSQRSAAQDVVALLEACVPSEGVQTLTLIATEPLSESIKAAYESQNVDVVVVVAKQWDDSLSELVSCVDELRFANAQIAGIVFCKKA